MLRLRLACPVNLFSAHGLWIGFVMTVGLLPAACAAAADPAWYIKKDHWHETMLASREALSRLEQTGRRGADQVSYVSPVVRGGEPARKISVPVSGLKELYLVVVGAPDQTYGAGTWAGPKLIDRDGNATLACHMESLDILDGQHDIDRNLKSGVSGPLRIAGVEFEHGIHVYANSKVRINLDGRYERFEASIGIDDWIGKHGAVRFRVAGPSGAAREDLWELVARDFATKEPRREMKWERNDLIWDGDWEPGKYGDLANRYAAASQRVPPLAQEAKRLAATVQDVRGCLAVRSSYCRSRVLDEALQRARGWDFRPLRMAIADLRETFGAKYPLGARFAERLAQLEKSLPAAVAEAPGGGLPAFEKVAQIVASLDQLQQESLLANPLMNFERLLLIKRVPDGDPRLAIGRGYGVGEFIGTPRQSSKCNPGIEKPLDWDNEIAVLSPVGPQGQFHTLYHSENRRLITDIDLHWNADRLLMSMPGSHDKWHVFEIGADGKGLRQLTPTDQPRVHYYDSCYLPNGDIAFVSTAPLQGVPCNTGVIVGMMYMMDGNGQNIRQICFEQDHSYCPTVLNDGRILYLRWDYTDTPHVWNRILFAMNPDGTAQTEYYGSNSYWPNSVFFARPIPGHPSKIVGIVTGHHVGRVGELIVFDPTQGRREADGVVQRIPGYGQKVEPLIQDKLTEHSWPKFVHPYPLSEKYFLVSGKPTEDSLWGIYLVDVFDNIVLIKEEEGLALVEPIPFRSTPIPPAIPSHVQPNRKDALVYVRDVYSGPGLKDIPRGTVKELRVFTYYFGYQTLAGIEHRVGADGPWEVKRVMGTVPVEADGSALFEIPAKTPISIQPLDAEGKALALMRSWMTAMPGEMLSCSGCHEPRNALPPEGDALALKRSPSEIAPWHGPTRGFSFRREVQPVLDKYCVGCHNGSPDPAGRPLVDLRADQGFYVVFNGGDPRAREIRGVAKEKLIQKYHAVFEPSYVALRRLVRVGGLESDLHLLPPMEFHANTSELVQMLRKGHYNVRLDDDAWDRLVTWIDLNAPCHGTWSEFTVIPGNQHRLRKDLQQLYGGIGDDYEQVPVPAQQPVEPVLPEPLPAVAAEPVVCKNWPFDAGEAKRRQEARGPATRSIDLGGGLKLELAKIPAGSFVMGDTNGNRDEQPQTAVTVRKPFWMSRCEITNRQYQQFDPTHDSRFEDRTSWIFSEEYLGWPANLPEQPVVRVSWDQAMAYCRWLTERTGMTFTLPTEAQWEYACRAGTATPLSYGGLDSDFSVWANLADYTIRDLAYQGWRPKSPDLVPRDSRFNDQTLVAAAAGSFQPNAWGLYDMHGNAAEWTRTSYRPYPYRDEDGRNDVADRGEKVVRGGSWYDRPLRCRSAFRLDYPPYQRVYNVGFRVVCEGAGVEVASTDREE